MIVLAGLLLLLSPEAERMLLGQSPFFRHEGMQRAIREGDKTLIEAAARSSYWDARRLAAEALGSSCPRELLADPVAVVREAAVRALDTAAPPDVLQRLAKDEDDAVRAAVAWALRAHRGKPALRKLMRDPSVTVRMNAFAAGGRFAQLRTMATSGDLPTAVPALWAMGRSGGASEASFLIARLSRVVKRASKEKMPLYLLDQPRTDVALARAVGDLARRGIEPGGRPVGFYLRRIVEQSGMTGSANLLLAEAIAGARAAESAQRVLEAELRLRKTSTLPNRFFQPALEGILHAFGRFDWPELSPLLLPVLEDRDAAVRLAVVRALAGPTARLGLRDRHPAVRAAACARIDAVEPLVRMLADSQVPVQAAAARALGRLGDPAAAPALERVLVVGGDAARLAAVGALLRIDTARRVDLLYKAALEDASPAVRAAAGAVLALLDDPGVLPQALRELGAPTLPRRSNALALVHALTNARIPYDPKQPTPGVARWTDWWKTRRQRRHAPDAFRYHVEDLRKRGIDLVLVMDATGSMSPVIQATKRRVQSVVERLRRVVPDLRARIVAYRDRGDAFLTVASPLTHEPRILEDFLACIPASGGGDGPEAVLDGLRAAIEKTPWRNKSHRVVLLFGDAPPHDRDEALLEAILSEFKGTVHTVDASGFGSGGRWTGNEAAFRRIAKAGRGEFIRVSDDADLLRSLLVLTLGPAHRAAIETLFGL